MLLALALPFEVISPWLRIGGLAVITNLELIAYAALALWVVRQVVWRQTPRWQTPFTVPIVGLLLALLLSALLAPSENLHALKVTARWCTGAAVFFMTVNAVDSGMPVRRLLQACILSGLVVAALALLEAAGEPRVMMLLATFRERPVFTVGGQVRASSTLAYATIAAMYLEFIFFFALGWLVWAWSRRRYALALILTGALLVVGAAIVQTLTRGALIAILSASALVTLVCWRRPQLRILAFAAVGACLSLGVLLLVSAYVNPSVGLRLATESDRSWFRASYMVAPLSTIHANEMLTTSVQVQNVGQLVWNAEGAQPVHLFYHWLSADDNLLMVSEGVQTTLPRDVAPGESVTLAAWLLAPSQPGAYVLGWDMVREDAFWFSVLGWPLYEMPVTVLPGREPADGRAHVEPAPNIAGNLNLERVSLWRAALQMLFTHPLSGVGPGNYRLVLGDYIGQSVW